MMNGISPTVSVVVLSYNRPAYLAEALASIRAQTFGPCEVTVVDNPSPASEEVARVVGTVRGLQTVPESASTSATRPG